MTDEDIKKIKLVFQEEIKPLHGEVAKLKQKLDESNIERLKANNNLRDLSKDLARLDSNIESLGEKIDALTVDVVDLQQTTGAIWDKISLESDKAKRETDEIKEHLGLPI